MAEQNYTIERDLKEARTMAHALVPYVYQDELYGRLGGSMPSLTLGALLLRLRRLAALRPQMTGVQMAALDEIERVHQAARTEWQMAYASKLLREAESRLKNMQAYFDEYDDNPKAAAQAYLPEALRRTIIQEIVTAAPEHMISESGLLPRLKKADGTLRRCVEPAPFLWSPLLESVYPADTFWWLVHRPPLQPRTEPDQDQDA